MVLIMFSGVVVVTNFFQESAASVPAILSEVPKIPSPLK